MQFSDTIFEAEEGLVLFVDIAGSTQLYERLGDSAAYTKITACLAQIGDLVKKYGGVVVKHIGDEILCLFEDVVDGIEAAVELQLQNWRFSSHYSLPVRVGCHYGPILVKFDDLFGQTVNIAAHLTSLATAHQILTSADTLTLYKAQVGDRKNDWSGSSNLGGSVQDRYLMAITPKNTQSTVAVHSVLWDLFLEDGASEWTQIKPPPSAPVMRFFRLEGLGRTYQLDASKYQMTVGRVADADILVPDRNVSRQHGYFEFKGGQVYFVDQSSNGTFIMIGDNRPQYLHRSYTLLSDHGQISFGAHFDEPNVLPFHYSFEFESGLNLGSSRA